MIESEAPAAAQDHAGLGSARGAVAVAGIATALVVAMWFAFYFLVFIPRAPAP
jgi:hypothetical protein